jgi:hypothetical protein
MTRYINLSPAPLPLKDDSKEKAVRGYEFLDLA